MRNQTPELDWRGDVPVSRHFDDPYFSLEDGLAETTHVFLAGNDLPNRFCDGFHIAELGTGTGLNLLAAWQSFRDSGIRGRLQYTGFEAFPMARADLERALAISPALSPFATRLLAAWTPEGVVLEAEDLRAKVVIGDARKTLSGADFLADCWFLDGFAPARNPELWEPGLLAQVAAKTKPGGSFATYTAAGHVRRALQNAGFDVTRGPGFGRKRHMSRGIRR